MRWFLFLLLFISSLVEAKEDIPKFPVDSAEIIQGLLDENRIVDIPPGVYKIGKTLHIPSKGALRGAGKGRTILKLSSGVNDDLIRTDGFEYLKGKKNFKNSPADFSIKDLTLDGNYMESKWNSSSNVINNSVGSCLKIYGKRFEIDVEINNCAEHAIYSEGQGPRFGEEVASVIKVFGTTFGKEALVFRGPADVLIEFAVLGLSGIYPIGVKPSEGIQSNLYSDTKHIDGVVIDSTSPYEGTVEIGFMHVYNAWSGFGFKTRGSPRVQIRHLISEGNLGGVAISRATWGGIGMLDIHTNGKAVKGVTDSTLSPLEGVLLESVGPFYISGGFVRRNKGGGKGWPGVRIVGNNQIVNIAINGNGSSIEQKSTLDEAMIIEGNSNLITLLVSHNKDKALTVFGKNNSVRGVIEDPEASCFFGGYDNQMLIVGGGLGCR